MEDPDFVLLQQIISTPGTFFALCKDHHCHAGYNSVKAGDLVDSKGF
jgi:hypothetical protein